MQFTSMKTWVFILMALRFFMVGAEELFITPTAWYYIKSLGQTKIFLGIVLSAFPMSAALAGPITGRLVDKYGHMKSIIILSFFMKCFGNVIYSVPVSPYFPLIGRVLSGLSDASSGVFYGQIALLTPYINRAKVFIFIDGMFVLGGVFGPAVSSFLILNVNILGWKIDAGNSPGVVLAVIWFFLLVVALWLPNEFGYNGTEDKSLIVYDDEEDLSIEDSSDPPNLRSCSTISLLLYLVFLSLFCSATVSFYVPLLAQEHFHLPFIHVKLLFLTGSMFATVLLLSLYIAEKYFHETQLLGFLMMMVISAIAMLTYFAFNWNSVLGNYDSYVLITYICFGSTYFSFALSCSLLSKITHPKDAAFYQGSSFAALQLGYVASRFIEGFIFTKTSLLYFCFALTLFWALGAVWLALEYRNLTRPAKVKT